MTHLERLETLSGAVNFNERVHRIVRPFIGRRVLEVGMGIGIFTEKILPEAESVVGVELVQEFVNVARDRFRGEAKLEIHQADMGAGIPPFLAGRSFDTVVCMNVLEHIEDDRSTLRDFHALLEPGGRVVLVVPQYAWLYGDLDSHDGHFRRYSRSLLGSRLRETGFGIEHAASFNMTGMLGWFVNGRLLRRKELPKGQMAVYDRLAPFLFWAESWVGPPLGLSLFMVGAKP